MEENKQDERQEVVDEKAILPNITNIKSSESYVLPSKGLVYDLALKMPQSITLRRMTTKEDKIRMRNTSENNIRKELLQACIVEPGIDAGNLTLIDANYLLFRLRVLSLLDDTYKISVRCPHCGTEFIHQINLSEVPVKYLEEDDLKLLKIELPISKAKVDLAYPSLNTMIVASEKLADYFDMFPNADRAEQIYTTSASIYVQKVNGKDMLTEEKDLWMDNLDIIDSRALRDVTQQLDNLYGYVDEIIGQCPQCSKDVPHGLPITSELFTPSK